MIRVNIHTTKQTAIERETEDKTMTEFTTREKIEERLYSTHNAAVIDYGDCVIVVEEQRRRGCIAEVYKLVDDPNETGFAREECRLQLIADRIGFEDTGHAIAWALEQV